MYNIRFERDKTIVTIDSGRATKIEFTGIDHEKQGMEFIRINMVHMGQIGE